MVNGIGSFRFSRSERLTHPQDFKRVMKTGRRLASRNFVVFVKENKLEFSRLGIVVSKEVGSAAYRNRIKRVCREFFRLYKHRIRGLFDIVILAKKGCSVKKYDDAKEELGRVLAL